MLGDDDVRDARPLAVLAQVVLLAIDEGDEVCVLLDLARFTKVRQAAAAAAGDSRPHARAGDTAITGTLKFTGEDLQATAHLGDLLDAAVAAVVGAQQLQVVDDDQAEAGLPSVLLAERTCRAGGGPWRAARGC